MREDAPVLNRDKHLVMLRDDAKLFRLPLLRMPAVLVIDEDDAEELQRTGCVSFVGSVYQIPLAEVRVLRFIDGDQVTVSDGQVEYTGEHDRMTPRLVWRRLPYLLPGLQVPDSQQDRLRTGLTMATTKREPLVRYVSPFSSPAWLARARQPPKP